MSREQFETWYVDFFKRGSRENTLMRDASGEYEISHAWNTHEAYKAGQAAQQWIPYKEGDSVVDGWQYVQCRIGYSGIAEYIAGVGFVAPSIGVLDDVIAIHPLPAPYGGE